MLTLLTRHSRVYLLRRYMHSFYFAITTLTTVGYGDINATNSMEMAFLSVRSIELKSRRL